MALVVIPFIITQNSYLTFFCRETTVSERAIGSHAYLEHNVCWSTVSGHNTRLHYAECREVSRLPHCGVPRYSDPIISRLSNGPKTYRNFILNTSSTSEGPMRIQRLVDGD